jgi:hypothetical protein
MSTRLRDVRLGPFGLVAERLPDGAIYARSPHPLGQHPSRLTERLEHWAERAPERTFLARRDDEGGWRRLTYAETLEGVRRIGQALLERRLSPERPLAILSGNDLEHALLARRPSCRSSLNSTLQRPLRGGPENGIPERQAMDLDGSHRLNQIAVIGGADRKGGAKPVDLPPCLARVEAQLDDQDPKSLSKALEGLDAVPAGLPGEQ